MTLDLDELERKAKAAAEWVNDPHAWNNGRLAPDVVLALIERVRDVEAGLAVDGTRAAEHVRALKARIAELEDRVRDVEAEKSADAERAEYWRVEANRVHAEALAKANERIRFLEGDKRHLWTCLQECAGSYAHHASDCSGRLGPSCSCAGERIEQEMKNA